ncbi:MAG: hypothetical protein WAZ12_01155 [Candidatus Absconditicoccaceae bacterium]
MPQLSIFSFIGFGLTIIGIGYIAVEIFGGDNYRFKKALDRNNRNLFDRLIHYVIRGGIINIIFLIRTGSKGLESLLDILNGSRPLANMFTINGQNLIETQLLIFSIQYFIIVTIFSAIIFYACKYAGKLGWYLGGKKTVRKGKK